MRSFLPNVLAIGILFVGALTAPADQAPRPVPPTPGPGHHVDMGKIRCYSSTSVRVKRGSCLLSAIPKGMSFSHAGVQRVFGRGGIPLPLLWRDDRGRCGASLQLIPGEDEGSIRLSYEEIDERTSDIMTKCEREGKYGGGYYDLAPHPFLIDLYATRGPGNSINVANSTTIGDGNAAPASVSASAPTAPAGSRPYVTPSPRPGPMIDRSRIICWPGADGLMYRVKKGECMAMAGAGLSLNELKQQRVFSGERGIPVPQTWADVRTYCALGLQSHLHAFPSQIIMSYANINDIKTDIMTVCEEKSMYGGGHYDLAPFPYQVSLWALRRPGVLMGTANSTTVDDNATNANTTMVANDDFATA